MSYVNSDECSRCQNEDRKIFCGMMQALDESIGNITKTLQLYGYLENTVIVFSSDNGGWVGYQDPGNMWIHDQGQNNFPMRAGKGSFFEGGIHVPGFIWGNAVRYTSSREYIRLTNSKTTRSLDDKSLMSFQFRSNALFCGRDWFPTLLSIAQVENGDLESIVRPEELISAYDQSKHLTTGGESPRKILLSDVDIRANRFRGAVRNHHYKIVFGANQVGCDGWYHAGDPERAEPICTSIKDCISVNPETLFFQISEDVGERYPLDLDNLDDDAQKNFDELSNEYFKWSEIMEEPLFPRNFSGVWSFDLDAQALPRFWNCSFHPFISTADNPIKIQHSCKDKSVQSCPVLEKESWKKYATHS